MENTQSINDLITKLCEKFLNSYHSQLNYSNTIDIKKIRSKCYEIILLKKHNRVGDDLENNVDPHCHLLAWQFQLMTVYNLPEHAEKLRLCCKKLQDLSAFDNATTANILLLLLQLRRVPKDENRIMETTLDRHYSKNFMLNKSSIFTYFEESRFHLPEESRGTLPQFSSEHFKLPIRKIFLRTPAFQNAPDFLNTWQKPIEHSYHSKLEDEGYESPLKTHQEENNIWELASKEPPNQHRTWEAFGCPNSLKEPPFLCESGSKPATWLHNLSASYQNLISENYYAKAIVEVPTKQFIKDLKYLLVGMESKTFKYNDKGELILISKTCVEGISVTAIESYCKDFLLCASCYKGLDNLCTPNPFTMKYVLNGYIFSELCESIKRYLSYYRLAALSISDSTHLLAFNERTKQLRNQITVLASVCKVGPFTESGQIPHGVALLNYLYQKVMSLTNKDVIMVLYSILYPCCQAYFSHFLQQWILEGCVQDPYGEFFITANPKYVISRGRTYWTRSYTLREDIVPDFVTDFRNDILFCGKAMNLLKLCVPNSPLCLYLVDKHPNIMSCCVTAEQLSSLELNNHYYYLEATALAGPRMLLSQAITCSHEKDNTLISLIAKKRASTLSRLELERRKEIEERFKEKQKQMKILQEQYDQAQKQRQVKVSEQLEEDIKTAQNDMKMEILHDRIIQEEANNLIKYYDELFKQAEKRRHYYEKRKEDLRRVHLEGGDNSDKVNIIKESDQSSIDLSVQCFQDVLVTKKLPGSTLSRSVSSDTFLSAFEDLPDIKSEDYVTATSDNSGKNLETLDIINANVAEEKIVSKDTENQTNKNYLVALENFQAAQKYKARALSTELGMNIEPVDTKIQNEQSANVSTLTDAQKNKLKVMASEYGSRLTDSRRYNSEEKLQQSEAVLTDAQKNKLKVMSSEFGNLNIVEEKKKTETVDEKNLNSLYARNCEIAEKNKAKVMSLELGITSQPEVRIKNVQNTNYYHGLTDAQKNKLKVLSSEFGYDMSKTSFASTTEVKQPTSILEINRNRMISSSDCFLLPQDTVANNKQKENVCDNENFVNKNITPEGNTDNVNVDKNSNKPLKWINKKQDKLSLDFTKVDNYKNINNNNRLLKVEMTSNPDNRVHPVKSPKFELDKISPMSVDSTPLSSITSPSSKALAMFDKNDFDNYSATTIETTSTAAVYETGFNFEVDKSESLLKLESRKSAYDLGSGVGNLIISKTISAKDALSVSPNCLKLYLQQSISIPLITQIKLVNNELLKYFINDLQYLKHLNSLRNYFFLMDGEFGRNITEGLFEKLYYANFPIDLINCHTLQALVYKALDYSTKFQENSSCLSFRINSLPKVFNLGDPDVFDCISLTYKTAWPLNILFPSETIAKYDEVFKFLLKLHRISWVLQNVFQDLKSLVKETAKHETVILMMSPQYRRLHQCRHVITHFIQTLQSYVVGEVLQSSWEIFEKNLELVTNFDQLYSLHTTYIKNILFMCLLNQKSAPLRKALQKIFIVILKFYDYLRSRSWIIENNVYVHPNFKKLEDIFSNFEDLTQYLFKVGHRVVKSGYQPHLMQLLDMLDINNYYSKRNVVSEVSISASSH